MEVFFSCSTDNILKYRDSYQTTVKTIKSLGHTLTRDWIDKSIELADKNIEDVSRDVLYTDVMSSILAADVTIFDCTVQSMSIGHQLTFALDKGKPTLLLAKREDESIENLFISGSKSNFLTLRNYSNVSEIPALIKEFLSKNSSKSKIRFQIILDKAQHDYIAWASFQNKNKNKSDIIKEAIDKKAEEDMDYQHYLHTQP